MALQIYMRDVGERDKFYSQRSKETSTNSGLSLLYNQTSCSEMPSQRYYVVSLALAWNFPMNQLVVSVPQEQPLPFTKTKVNIVKSKTKYRS